MTSEGVGGLVMAARGSATFVRQRVKRDVRR